MDENNPIKKEEKTYRFTLNRGQLLTESVIVKESELTKPQKDLLLGEVIRVFNGLPDELKSKFMNGLYDAARENIQLNPSPQKKRMQDLLVKTAEDALKKEMGDE